MEPCTLVTFWTEPSRVAVFDGVCHFLDLIDFIALGFAILAGAA
jgi:hypothetical protein